jgi:hypothetical protein
VIVVDTGEAVRLALPPPDAASVVNEFAADQVALRLRAQGAGRLIVQWRDAVRRGLE